MTINFQPTSWVFISSVGEECSLFREAATKAALRAHFLPIRLETWSAEDRNSCDACKNHLSRCNVMILILTDRYGSVHFNSEKSYTEMEYDTALELKIPVLAFIAQNPTLTTDRIDPEDLARIKKFRDRLGDKIQGRFQAPERLETLILQSLHEWRNDFMKINSEAVNKRELNAGRDVISDSSYVDLDIAAFKRMQSIINSGWIQNFEYSQLNSPQYVRKDIRDKFMEYTIHSAKPENEFINDSILDAHNNLLVSINSYLDVIALNTTSIDGKEDWLITSTKAEGMREWVDDYNKRYKEEVDEIYSKTETILEKYRKFIRICRKERLFQ